MNTQEIVRFLEENEERLAKLILKSIFQRIPALKNIYDDRQKQHSLQDLRYHLEYLEHSIRLDQPKIFRKYIKWVRVVLENRGLTADLVKFTFEDIKKTLIVQLNNKDANKILNKFFYAIDDIFSKDLLGLDNFIKEDNPYKKDAKNYLKSVLRGDRKKHFQSLTH